MISIIVPVYNAESFINRCIESIIAQSVRDWELLLIDDGSFDSSGSICDDYAKRDSRIRVFHKANGGVSSARNVGLEEAKGDWVAFVDADDCINECYLNCVEKDSDIVFTDTIILSPNGTLSSGKIMILEHLKDYKMFVQENLQNERLRTPWGKLIKKSVIGNLRFPLDQRIGEDTVFVYKLLSLAKSVDYNERSKYIWQKGEIADTEKYHLSVDDDIRYLNAIFDSYEKIGVRSKDVESFFLSYFFTLVDKNKPLKVYKWFNDNKIAGYLKSLYGSKLPLSFQLWKSFPLGMYFLKKIFVLLR